MGHNRLGTLPDTRPWARVVGHLADGQRAAVVAASTSRAAVAGLQRGANDPGVAHVVFLLARVAIAARQRDFATALAELGIRTPPEPSLFDLTAALATATSDWHTATATPRTDLGVMATLAASEAVTLCVGARVEGLFPTGDEVRSSVREFSTKNGFSNLAHEFFSCFVRRFLLYHLGRELSQHVGGNGRFADHAAHTAFVEDLRVHCRETAVIARDYSGGWYDKTRFLSGISEQKARGFTAYCLGRKLRRELARRGERHG